MSEDNSFSTQGLAQEQDRLREMFTALELGSPP